MSDDIEQVWLQQEGESLNWYKRFNKFRFMSLPRSVAEVYRSEKKGDNRSLDAPGSYYDEVKKWNWYSRVAAWDTYQDTLLEQAIAQEKNTILKSEYAQMYKRVKGLNERAKQLEEMLSDAKNIWLIDMKGNPFFNDALFREYRAALTDVASEMGERVKISKQEITGRNGGPVETTSTQIDLSKYTDDEIRLLLQLAQKANQDEQENEA